MKILGICMLAQFCVIFGLASLIWPERFVSTFDVLMFPWPASTRMIRTSGMMVLGTYLLLVIRFLTVGI